MDNCVLCDREGERKCEKEVSSFKVRIEVVLVEFKVLANRA